MAITWKYAADYCAIGVDWKNVQTDTYVTLAPVIYRWDAQSTDNYGGSFADALELPDGSTKVDSGLKFGSGSGEREIDSWATRSYSRGHTARTVLFWLGTSDLGSWYSGSWHSLGSPEWTWSFSVPALASYSVTFNANGGSGAPSAQTKWFGETLMLSSTVPTKANHNFRGWATSSGATTPNYQPGDAYTGNAALALYAVWELAALPPSVSITGYRVASNSATTEDPNGGYAYIQVPWSVDTTMVSGNRFSSISANYKKDGGSATSVNPTATQSGTSGTAYFRFTAATGSTFAFTVTITDTNGVSTQKSLTISDIKYPIYVYDRYKVKIDTLSLTHALPIGSGGTGSTSAANARSALGVPSKPVLLYDNDNGSSSITLSGSDSFANYEHITICFKMSADNNYSSVEVWHPNGKSVSLMAGRPYATGVWNKTSTYTISGNKITLKSGDVPVDWYIDGSSPGSSQQTANIYITQIIGYKST